MSFNGTGDPPRWTPWISAPISASSLASDPSSKPHSATTPGENSAALHLTCNKVAPGCAGRGQLLLHQPPHHLFPGPAPTISPSSPVRIRGGEGAISGSVVQRQPQPAAANWPPMKMENARHFAVIWHDPFPKTFLSFRAGWRGDLGSIHDQFTTMTGAQKSRLDIYVEARQTSRRRATAMPWTR